MLEASWIQPLPGGFVADAELRYLTQSAASFYHDPPFPQGFVPGEIYTADTRLSAFGAITAGRALCRRRSVRTSPSTSPSTCIVSARAGTLAASGSPGLAEFSARWIEVGLEKRF